jgi:uncharacterized membrane protein
VKDLGLVAAAFLSSGVEFVEALTIVLAMGYTRGFRSSLAGAAAAVALLAAITALAGGALVEWVPEQVLLGVIGAALLVFGFNWLRKAVLRSAGRKALHDEEAEFAEQTAAAASVPRERRLGMDGFAAVVSFKGVFLEGVEVVFIVASLGASSGNLGLAAAAACTAFVVVVVAGVALHRPLARVPENLMKYAVGLMLCSFGVFWLGEGLGIAWPGQDVWIAILLVLWLIASQLAVRALRAAPAGAA